MESVQYHIGGMACSFCAQSIEQAFQDSEGIEQVNVSLAHERVLFRIHPDKVDRNQLTKTLKQLGYTIRDPDKVKAFEEQQEELRVHRNRLLTATGFTLLALVLMTVMWAGIYAWWHPWGGLVLALLTMFGPGLYIKKKAWQSLRRGILNQHVLLELGAFGGLAGGFIGFFSPWFPSTDFFGVSVFITTYHILSGWAANKVRARASQAVRKLLSLQPDTARQIDEQGNEKEVSVDDLNVGDHVRIRPGENIPVDGKIIEGHSGVDESVVTGESMPADKAKGDKVVGGSINQTGSLTVEITRLGKESFLQQIAHHIEEARAMKPGIIQLADKILRYYVPTVIAFGGLALLIWSLGSWILTGTTNWTRGLFAMLAVFVMGYPCALGMATPLAMIRGGGMAADHGILMRSGDAFQLLKDIDTVVLDKTGTLTVGKPSVLRIMSTNAFDKSTLLRYTAAVEYQSEHPLARAVINYVKDKVEDIPKASEFESRTGQGVSAKVNGEKVHIGNPEYIQSNLHTDIAHQDWVDREEEKGHTVVAVAVNHQLAGFFALADTLKSDARQTVSNLKQQHRKPVLLTGDTKRTARAIAREIGIDKVEARVLPDEKADRIRDFQQNNHRVAMVGDGINDAPSLSQADVGIAIGTGTDIAIESADVILMGERLSALTEAFDIGKNSYRKTKQNLVLAFLFNGIGVPLAVTGWVPPIWAMIAMVASVTTILINSFAGRLISIPTKSDDEASEITLTVPDMHCDHCIASIKKTLQSRFNHIQVHVDLDSKQLKIERRNGEPTREGVREALMEIGFRTE